jgi:hypothetical protein
MPLIAAACVVVLYNQQQIVGCAPANSLAPQNLRASFGAEQYVAFTEIYGGASKTQLPANPCLACGFFIHPLCRFPACPYSWRTFGSSILFPWHTQRW